MKRIMSLAFAICMSVVNAFGSTQGNVTVTNDSVVFIASNGVFEDDGFIDAPEHDCDEKFMSLWIEAAVPHLIMLKGNVMEIENAQNPLKSKPTYSLDTKEEIIKDYKYCATDESGTGCIILFTDDSITISYKHMKYVYIIQKAMIK